MKKFCITSGTRADFGLLKNLIYALRDDEQLDYKLVVMGTHFSSEYGNSYEEILDAGLSIDFRCDMLLSSTSHAGVAKSFGLTAIAMADYFGSNNFDAVVVLGDRYEALAVSSVALIFNIPIIHLCGGEVTSGAIDDSIRHSITKMSSLHFVSNKEYERRVIQLGENDNTVHITGGLGVDAISSLKVFKRSELEKNIDFKFGEKNLIVTFHPAKAYLGASEKQLTNLLAALHDFQDIFLIFTMPNADAESDTLWNLIKQFVAQRENSILIKSMGQKNYYSALKIVDGVIGNSSSGISEAPSFGIGTINIGDRQKGRLLADSIISCDGSVSSIKNSINLLYSKGFRNKLSKSVNPYGRPGAVEKIMHVLKKIKSEELVKQPFKDINYGSQI